MKNLKLIIVLLSTFFCTSMSGQLQTGSFAPDFSGVDLNGKTWNLYEILDEGKSVIVEVSSTWCGPCWDYHNTHQMSDLYEQYGPDGTNELMVLFIEGDESTNTNCLYGEDGCNGFTYGNWVEGTPYPIIDDASIAELLEVIYYPTFYLICQNRIVREVGALTTEDLFNFHNNCDAATGSVNASVVDYTGFLGRFCDEQSFSPSFVMQNLGEMTLTSADINLYKDGTIQETLNWEGNLKTFQSVEVFFGNVVVSNDAEFRIEILNPNNSDDDDTSDNDHIFSTLLSIETDKNILTVDINPSNNNGGIETYWEIVDSDDNVLYRGGNRLVIDEAEPVEIYTIDGATIEIAVPSNGCYSFNLYDWLSDGFDNISYTITDQNGEEVISGPSEKAYKELDSQPFTLAGSSTITNNATILNHGGEEGYFCGEYQFTPVVNVRNLGANEIADLRIDVRDIDDQLVYSYDWNGIIEPHKSKSIELLEINVEDSETYAFVIGKVNNEDDSHTYNEAVFAKFNNSEATTKSINIELQYDLYGDESGFVLTNSSGVELLSGLGSSEYLYKGTVDLVDGVDDCYTLTLLDSFGDGISISQNFAPYIKISDADEVEILYEELSGIAFESLDFVFEGNRSMTNTLEPEVSPLSRIYPNPAHSHISVESNDNANIIEQVIITDALGKKVKDINLSNGFGISDLHNIDVSDLPGGFYIINIYEVGRLTSGKFEIMR